MKWVFAVYSAIVVAVVVHVLRRKRVPSVAAAWALTVILFPVAGMLLAGEVIRDLTGAR